VKYWSSIAVILGPTVISSSMAFGEALNTTSVGIGTRTGTLTPQNVGSDDSANASSEAKAEPFEQEGLMVCNRVSTPSSLLSMEIGAGGCMMMNQEQTEDLPNFAHSISGHVAVLYYPFASRRKSNEDSAIRIKLISFSNVYIMGMGGFSKFTTAQALGTTRSNDALDAGIGGGYSYRLFKYVSFGAEGYYMHSSILSSKVATGSAATTVVSGILTVYL